jgi:hypothetical protein
MVEEFHVRNNSVSFTRLRFKRRKGNSKEITRFLKQLGGKVDRNGTNKHYKKIVD